MDIDLLVTTSTYMSPAFAVKLVESTKHIPGRAITIISGPIEKDITDIAAGLIGCQQEYALFHSSVNSCYLCKNWGFLCAIMMDIKPKWLCHCDDDIEFWPDADCMFQRLEEAEKMGFCLLAFRNPNQEYAGAGMVVQNGFRTDLHWMDENAMFSKWEDNLQYGIPDSVPGEPITFFVGLEYQHRMTLMSGRPIIADLDKYVYLHHFRDDPSLAQRRKWEEVRGMNAGSRLWEIKYDFHIDNWNNDHVHKDILAHVSKPENREKMKRHVILNNVWTDWPEAIKFVAPQMKLIKENIRWK